MINLSVSTAPITIPTKTFAGFLDAHVYLIQVTEDGRTRYRLRLGPFANEDDADAILEEVRDLYPGALTATAIVPDLRTIASMQAKLDAQRVKRPVEKVVEEISIDLPPLSAALAVEAVIDLEKLLQSAASAAMQPPAPAPAPARAPAPAAVAAPPKPVPAPEVVAAPKPAPATVPEAASAPPVKELPLELSPDWAIPVLNARVVPVKQMRPAFSPAPIIANAPASIPKPVAPKPAAVHMVAVSKPTVPQVPKPTLTIPTPVVHAPTQVASKPAPVVLESITLEPITLESIPIVAIPILPMPAPKPVAAAPIHAPVVPAPSVAAAPATPAVAAPKTVVAPPSSAAPVLTEIVAPAKKAAVVKPARMTAARMPNVKLRPAPVLKAVAPKISAPSRRAPPLPIRRAFAPTKSATPPVVVAPVHAAPLVTGVVSSSPPTAPTIKPSTSGFAAPQIAGSVSLPAPRQVKQLEEPLESLECTQTVRALTPPELEDQSLRWYVIQLALADHAFDPDAVPNLDIFSEYRLYSVAGVDQGRTVHALRLGFFGEEIAAVAVASYLAAYYDKPTVRRVSVAERERFLDQRVEARKDVGATGRHAVIEITDELVARYRRTPSTPATPESPKSTGGRWVPSPR